MPLSSSSLPSLVSAGSASEDIAAPSLVRLAMLSASDAPKTAGGKDRKSRPNLPSNKGERAVDINPRGGSPCLALIKRLLLVVGGRLLSFAQIKHNPFLKIKVKPPTCGSCEQPHGSSAR